MTAMDSPLKPNLRLQTPVELPPLPFKFGYSDRITLIGSCFAANVGEFLASRGFDVMVNPFGTLFNPVSVASCVRRLDDPEPFTPADCVELGAGDGRIGSFSLHTSFARESAGAFLDHSNGVLSKSSAFWKGSGVVILTLGTAWVYALADGSGKVVSNCLKRPASEFVKKLLTVDEVAAGLRELFAVHPEKKFIVTVSPVRHPGNGAHGNQVSKSVLVLGVEKALESCSNAAYFPAYELVLDELRDYRWYAEDLVHPSRQAVGYICESFISAALDPADTGLYAGNCRKALASAHRPLREE